MSYFTNTLNGNQHRLLLSPSCPAFFCSICLTLWFISSDFMMQWLGKALANSRNEGEKEPCGEPLFVLCLQKPQTFFFYFFCVEILLGFGPGTHSLVLKKMNDTLLKMIIDWVFGWMGSNCPPACRSGRSSSTGLNMIKPPGYDSQLLAKSFPLSHHKSQLMRHRAFSLHSVHPHCPAAHKQERTSAATASQETWRSDTCILLMQFLHFWS